VRRERVAGLSKREIEVLRLLARGYSNRQMAQALGITKKTAGNHVVHIYEKIGCSTRSAARYLPCNTTCSVSRADT
jgi:DNA-binding CsgD family transcriptional regulator